MKYFLGICSFLEEISSLSHSIVLLCFFALEWVAYPFSRRSSQPRNRTGDSCIVGRFFTNWTTREIHSLLSPWGKPQKTSSTLPRFPHLCYRRAHPLRPWVEQHLAKSGLNPGSAVWPGADYLPLSLGFLNCKTGEMVLQRIVRMKRIHRQKNLILVPDT